MIYPIVTLTQIKSWLKETTTTNDTVLGDFQQTVTDIVEQLMNQFGVVRAITEYHDGDGGEIFTRKFPVYSISELNDDVNYEWNSTTEIESDNYQFANAYGEIILVNDYSVFLTGKQNVKITYRAGLSRFEVITGVNDTIDFNEGSALAATVAAGIYDAEDLATAIATAMNTAGALTYTCVYVHNTQKFVITGNNTLDYLWLTGVNLTKSIASLINQSLTDISAAAASTSGEVLGLPFDVVNAAQQILYALHSMSKQGSSIQMIKQKQMAASGGAGSGGTIEYYGDKLPQIAVNALRKRRRIGF